MPKEVVTLRLGPLLVQLFLQLLSRQQCQLSRFFILSGQVFTFTAAFGTAWFKNFTSTSGI